MWQAPKTFPELLPNQIHIWRAPLQKNKKELEEFFKLLNPEETDRANKFIVDHAKNNFIAARGILRSLLANYLQIKPQDLIFQQNQHGKLYLESSDLQFNISHSHGLALFAFTLNHEVGVDVEFIRNNFEFIDIAQRFFSKKENDDLLALPKDQQLHAFFNCWSRKEAFIKAIGKGIFYPLDKFSVEISNKKTGKLSLEFAEPKPYKKNWSLEALDPDDGYVGAFATSSPKYQPHFYDFSASHCKKVTTILQ